MTISEPIEALPAGEPAPSSIAIARALSPEQAVALEQATQPCISPDGRLVAYCVSDASKPDEHGSSSIFVVAADGGAPPRRFSAGTARDAAPCWSPDCTWLAFVSDRHERGTPGLYVMPADGGEAQRILHERGEASAPRWSPDGTYLYLSVLLKEIEEEEEQRRKKDQRDDAIVVDDDKLTGLWLVDMASASRQARCLSPAELNVWMHAWSPDGRRIAFIHSPSSRVNDAYGAYTLSIIGVSPPGQTDSEGDGDGAAPLRAVCRLYGDTVGSLCWSPDGTRLAVIGPRVQQPFVLTADVPLIIPASGGAAEPAIDDVSTQFNWVAWLSNDELVAAGDEQTGSVYYRLSLNTHELQPLFPDGQPAHGSPRELSLSQNRAMIAFTHEDCTSPGDVWTAAIGLPPRRLSRHNPELDALAWGSMEQAVWTAPDGLEIQGLLIKPIGYKPGRRYPTIIQPHGGPAWLWNDRFYASWHDWGQFLAARGYAVLLPNPRGSTGRGTAFLRGNMNDFGGGEWQDILAGAHWAIDSGIADPERMGIGGWSWGGYLAAWAITQTTLFKAAVVGAGCTNLVSDHGLNDCPDMNQLYFADLPYADAAPYWDRSPLKYVTSATTPTLILHGQEDEIVAAPQAREFYRALKTCGVPTQLVEYPREGHSIAERAHQLDLLRRVLSWFDKYLAVRQADE